MNKKKTTSVILALLFTLGTTTALNQEYRQKYDWRNSADHTGVTWDGIQDHPDNKLVQGYKYGSITEGLVGYWSFEDKRPEGPKDQALDNHGTFYRVPNASINGAEWVKGIKGNYSLRFNNDLPSGAQIDSSTLNSLDPTEDTWTISTNVKHKSGTGGSIALRDHTKCSIGVVWSPEAEISTQGVQMGARDCEGSPRNFSDHIEIPSNETTHIAAVFDGNNLEGKIYVNGKLEDTVNWPSDIEVTQEDEWQIGGDSKLAGGQDDSNTTWIGDNVKFHNRALNTSQIKELAEGKNRRKYLSGEWVFEEGEGNTAYDTSNWKNGKLGKYSAKLNGSSYFKINNTSDLKLEDDLTISVWAKLNSSIYDPSSSAWEIIEKDIKGEYRLSAYESSLYFWHGSGGEYAAFRFNTESNEGYLDDEWHQFTLVRDVSKQKVTAYMDGDKMPEHNHDSWIEPQKTNDPIHFGTVEGKTDTNRNFHGKIDSVRIYDRSLSSKEVQKLYNQNSEQKISPQDTLQSGLVGWWPLHETSGQTAKDLSGNNNDGTLGNSTLGDDAEPTQGVAGVGGKTAYSFDGSDDLVNLTGYPEWPSKTSSNFDNPHTLTAWIQADTENQEAAVVGKFDDAGSSHWTRFGDGIKYVNGKVQAHFRNDDRRPRLNYSLDSPTEWHHVAVTGFTEEGKLWVDGELVREGNLNSGYAYDFAIGAEIYDEFSRNFDGKIADVRVYDRGLSNSEIRQIYQQGSGDYATPPDESDEGVAYWSFDNDDGDRIVNDEWGNHDGVMGNSSDFTQPSYTDGKIGEGLEFDGKDDVIYFDQFKYQFGETASVSAWVNLDEDCKSRSQEIINPKGSDWVLRCEHRDDSEFSSPGNTFKDGIQWQIEIGGEWYNLDTDVETDTWNFIAGTYKSPQQRLYLNGKLVDSYTIPGELDGSWTDNENGGIGANANAGNYLNGSLDSLRVYNSYLSASEVHELYQHGTSGRDMRQITRNQGLVGYWSLDEDSGQTAYDLSGHGNHGTLGNSSTPNSKDPTQGAEGVLGTSAYSFDGENDHIDTGEPIIKDSESDMAITAWIKPGKDSLGDNRYRPIVSQRNNYSNLDFEFYIGDDLAEGYDFTWGESGKGGVETGQNPEENTWTHVGLVKRNNTVYFYENGEEIHKGSDGDITWTGSEPLQIGSWDGGSTFDGSIDNVRIYNRSLTPSEVQSLYSTSQRGEITTRSDFRSPTRAGIRGGIFNPGNGSLEAELVGSPDVNGFRESVNSSVGSDSQVYTFDWNRSHRVFDTSIIFDNENVSTSSSSVEGFAVNISRYVNGFSRQLKEGVFDGSEADTGDEVKVGSGYSPGGSLVGYWDFNGEDRTVEDRSDHGNDGTLSGSSIEFDGEDDYINLSSSDKLDQSLEYTFNAWVKVRGSSTKNTVFWHGKNQSGTLTENTAYSVYTENGDLKMRISDGTSEDIAVAKSNLDNGRWKMITGELSSEALRLYIDGEQVDQLDRSVSPQTAGSTFIGADTQDGNFNGHIDEPRLYSEAIEKYEIKDIYQGESIQTENLVMHQSFDERVYRTEYSYGFEYYCPLNGTRENKTGCLEGETSNNINGTPLGFENNDYTGSGWSRETGEASQIWDKEGIRDQNSFKLDGEDDYIDLDVNTKINATESSITVSAWIKPDRFPNDQNSIFGQYTNSNETYSLTRNYLSAKGNGSVFWDQWRPGGGAIYTEPIPTDVWTHIVAVQEGDYRALYVDGEKVSSDYNAETWDGEGAEIIETYIGGRLDVKHFFDGKIEEVKVYGEDLSNRQIKELYNPSPGTFTSNFFDAGKSIDWDSFSWSEEVGSGEDVQGRVQTASEVKETSEYSEWVEGSSSFSGPKEGLVGYWRFENPDVSSSGGTVKDWSGNGNNGTTKNNVNTHAEGFRPQSNAYSFDGSDDYVEVYSGPTGSGPSSLSFSQSDSFTVSSWVRIDGENDQWQEFFSMNDVNSGSTALLRLRKAANKSINYALRDNNDNIELEYGPAMERNEWYHVTWVRDSSKSVINLYLDGEKVSTVQDDTSADFDQYSDIRIGSDSYNGGRNYWNGKIDELRIYKEALDTSEVNSIYSSGSYTSDWIKASNVNWAQWKQTKKGTDLKPMAQWRFDEGSGQYANDSVGDNDGTLGGSTSSESSDPTWKKDCRYRGCLEFDGNNDRVDVPHDSTLDLGTHDFSFSFWMKRESVEEDQLLIDKATDWREGFNLRIESPSKLAARIGNSSSSSYNQIKTGDNTIKTKRWHHVAITVERDGQFRVYIDAQEKGNTSATTTGNIDFSNSLVFGYNRCCGAAKFDGKMDDIRYYNRSLSDSSVRALYNAPSQSWASTSLQVRSRANNPESDSLVANYNFEGVGQTVMDASGNGNSLVLGRNASRSNSDPQRANGYSGQGLRFDGSDDYAYTDLDSNEDLQLWDSFTLSAWFKPRDDGNEWMLQGDAYYTTDTGYSLIGSKDRIRTMLQNDTGGDQFVDFYPGESLDGWNKVSAAVNESMVYLYLNGEKVKEESRTVTSGKSYPHSPFYIGRGGYEASNYYNGSVDEIKIYDEALSSAEIGRRYELSEFTPSKMGDHGTEVDSGSPSGHYQFKLNSLTGISVGVPEVESVTLANVSSWSAWTSQSGVGLDMQNNQYAQAQFNLSSENATSTPVLESFGFGVPREPVSLNAAPVVSEADPDDENIYYEDGELSVRVGDSDDSSLSGEFLNASSNAVIDTFTLESNGTVSATWNDLVRDAVYEWSVSVSDGVSTTSETYNFTTYDVNLTWMDNSSKESGFRVYSNLTGSFKQIGRAPANSESFLDSSAGLAPGKYVCYRVRAYNSAGESPPAETCIDTSALES